MILTNRLELVPATLQSTRAAMEGQEALGRCLGVRVPPSWPPEYMDRPAFEFTLARLLENPREAEWWLHFVVLPRGEAGRTLIGTAGYKGPPLGDGTVELGYGIVKEYRRQGYATETVKGLLAHAFGFPSVRRAIAETLPELAPSIGVLGKCGFCLIGSGSEPGVIRFELGRSEYSGSPRLQA